MKDVNLVDRFKLSELLEELKKLGEKAKTYDEAYSLMNSKIEYWLKRIKEKST